MYAVIKTGGKQYRVQPGDVIQVETLDNKLGSELTIKDVLMVGGDKTHVGAPVVKDAAVVAVVTKQARTMKVFVFKKKRRHGYRRFGTHKQNFTELFIKSISSPDGQSAKAEKEPVVRDVLALRQERQDQKTADSRARAAASVGQGRAAKLAAPAKPVKKTAVKKVAKKAIAKKAPSKRAAKTAVKKTAKKVKK